MDATQIKATLQVVIDDINLLGDYAGIIDPALVPFIAIGKAIDKQIPGLAASVANLIQGTPPSDADLQDKAQELAVLSDKGGI